MDVADSGGGLRRTNKRGWTASRLEKGHVLSRGLRGRRRINSPGAVCAEQAAAGIEERGGTASLLS